jgi:hypothetical protein
MRGIRKFLLLDKRIRVQPVEQLCAIGANHLGLRIMDVGVNEAGRDEATAVVVDKRAARRAGENGERFADRLNLTPGDKNSAVVDQGAGARAAYRRIIGEPEDAAANDAGLPGQGRMSLSLSAAIRSISASAVAVSASASLARRARKAARMSAVLLPLTAMIKGNPNLVR